MRLLLEIILYQQTCQQTHTSSQICMHVLWSINEIIGKDLTMLQKMAIFS